MKHCGLFPHRMDARDRQTDKETNEHTNERTSERTDEETKMEFDTNKWWKTCCSEECVIEVFTQLRCSAFSVLTVKTKPKIIKSPTLNRMSSGSRLKVVWEINVRYLDQIYASLNEPDGHLWKRLFFKWQNKQRVERERSVAPERIWKWAGGTGPARKWKALIQRKALENFFLVVLLHFFGSKSTIN